MVEDDQRSISVGGWDATKYPEKNSDLGDCCLWIAERDFSNYDLEPYTVDEWDGGRR